MKAYVAEILSPGPEAPEKKLRLSTKNIDFTFKCMVVSAASKKLVAGFHAKVNFYAWVLDDYEECD